MTVDVPTTEVSAAAYTIPTEVPEADGTFAWESTTMVLVQAGAGGHRGIGWTYGPAAAADLVRGQLSDIAVGRSAMDVTGTFMAMVRSIRNVGRSGIGGQAISAIDMALWDLKARLLDLPLHRLLGNVHSAIPIYGSGGFTNHDQSRMVRQLNHWTNGLGARAVKIKIAESTGARVDRDLDRMRSARETIGPDVDLMVDANGGYQRKQAIGVMRDAADLNVVWFEEPVSSDDVDGLRSVRDAVDADVTAGEYGYDTYYFRRLCEARAVDCLQVDASRCGGVTGWLSAAAVAGSYGLDISGHCAPYLHRHAAAATPNVRHLEWFHDHARIERTSFDGADQPLDGMLHTDAGRPGNGLAFRSPDMERYRVL